MDIAEKFHALARSALDEAATLDDPDARALFLSIAKGWLELAAAELKMRRFSERN
jgi:hypothetical protein